MDGETERLLAVIETRNRPLQLVEAESLQALSQRFSMLEPELRQSHHKGVRHRGRRGWKGHSASVISGLVRSAGLLPYRRGNQLEVLIAHPGGPFFARRDRGWWSIVKGVVEQGETLEATAAREFNEETGWEAPPLPWVPLGETTLKSRKVITAWAVEADLDPATLVPGTFQIGGRSYPEIDRVEWVGPDLARVMLNAAQAVFIDRLEGHLRSV